MCLYLLPKPVYFVSISDRVKFLSHLLTCDTKSFHTTQKFSFKERNIRFEFWQVNYKFCVLVLVVIILIFVLSINWNVIIVLIFYIIVDGEWKTFHWISTLKTLSSFNLSRNNSTFTINLRLPSIFSSTARFLLLLPHFLIELLLR